MKISSECQFTKTIFFLRRAGNVLRCGRNLSRGFQNDGTMKVLPGCSALRSVVRRVSETSKSANSVVKVKRQPTSVYQGRRQSFEVFVK